MGWGGGGFPLDRYFIVSGARELGARGNFVGSSGGDAGDGGGALGIFFRCPLCQWILGEGTRTASISSMRNGKKLKGL